MNDWVYPKTSRLPLDDDPNKILHPNGRVGVFLPALEGGGENVMLDLAEGFLRYGLAVDIVLCKVSPDGPFMDRLPPGAVVVDLQADGPLRRLLRLTAYLRRRRLAALVTFYDFFHLASLAKLLARSPTSIIHGVHNTISELLSSQSGSRSLFRRWAFPQLVPLADAIVAVSEGVATDLARHSRLRPGRVHVIYNPILPERISQMAQEPVDHPFFQQGAPPVVIGIGQLAERKGFRTLIRAFAQLRQSLPARLVILGEGPQRPELEALIHASRLEPDVWLPGFVSNPYAYLGRSSVFVLSSRFEGLGMVLVEALALGIPVVSTDCRSGPAEILANGAYGDLVPVDDASALAAAIHRALIAPRHIPPTEAIERFRLDRAVSKYLELVPSLSHWPTYQR